MYWCREMLTSIRYNSAMFLRMGWLMRGISVTGNGVFNKLGNLVQAKSKSLSALFNKRKLITISPKNYLAKVAEKFSGGIRPKVKNAGFERFNKIRPHAPQPKLTIPQPLREEPAALGELRTVNNLLDKLPSPPTHTPVARPANGSKTRKTLPPFNQNVVMNRISRANTVAELVSVWTDLKNLKEEELITFEQYLPTMHACGDRLITLCSRPDQVDQIDHKILGMILDPKKQAAANLVRIKTRYTTR